MGLFSKLFGTYSEKQIKGIIPLVDKIEAREDYYMSLTDGELRECTATLKEALKKSLLKENFDWK